ncbi:MAG TPA: hypothetical protein VEQ10_12270 [Vicinamibacteria bacterium]|nr:hypothetical protein [Vicinamibacteria bacterium]
MKPSAARCLLITAYLASFAVVAWLFVRGASYYATPLGERAHHAGYWDYKAGGRVGHALGVAGTAMLVTMLAYSVRKRVPMLRRAGPLSLWLDGHIYLGVFGPLLVVLHSAFKVQGLVALSFWSMVLVAASGVLGRYLYLQIPRTRAGEELALADLERQDRELAALLRTRFGLSEAQLAQLDALPGGGARPGVLGGLVGIVTDDLRLRSAVRGFAGSCRSVPPTVFREFERVVRQKAHVRRRIRVWDRLHSLFHYWHVLHKPFAVVMYVFLAVHVAVALATGYGWRSWS